MDVQYRRTITFVEVQGQVRPSAGCWYTCMRVWTGLSWRCYGFARLQEGSLSDCQQSATERECRLAYLLYHFRQEPAEIV